MTSAFVASALLLLQAIDPVTGNASPDLLADITLQVVERARTFAGAARLSDGSLLPVETAEDRQRFAIPTALEAQTVRRGMLTGQMEFCDGDGVGRSFRPYMNRLRASGRYSDHQLAYVAVLHGTSQQTIMGAMEESGTDEICSDAFRSRLVQAADTDPIQTP